MVKKMLINAAHMEECRVAVVSDGILEELDVQIRTREATLGNIYKGVITRVEPSLQAAFVDYGVSRNGFLSINDVHPSYFPESFFESRRRPRIQDLFKKEDHVIVQVNKEERHTKGASLTTNISLAGRYLVLMPGTDLCGVSRKIEDEKERKKLKEILKQLTPPENMGFIIRTAGMGRTKTELSRDLAYLLKIWQSIEKNVADQVPPALLYREHDVVIRSIIEHFSADICEILVDDKDAYAKAKDFFHQVMPKYENLVKLSQERRPLFNKYQLEEQIEQVYRKRINLKSGGYILIEPTEAMVTVDVNSGSATKEKGIEDTAYRVNMEAAPEIARQLRLRDLGGIIVIDFIDMVHKKHKSDVEKTLRGVLKDDRAKSKILRISTLGLLELSRQRLKSSLGTGQYLDCPLCDGRGKVRSAESTALVVFRRIKSLLTKGDVPEVRATVPAKVAEYLLNNMRSHLAQLESQHNTRVNVLIRHSLPDKDVSVEAVREEAVEVPTVEAAVPQLAVELLSEVQQPPQPVAVAEEPVEEAEDKKTRKPGRRRRRGRKKPVAAPEAEVVASESAEPEHREGEVPIEPSEPASLEEVLLLTLRETLPESKPVLPEEPKAGESPEELRAAAEALPSTQEPAETPEPQPASVTAPAETESGSGEPAAQPELTSEEKSASKEVTGRKISLQSYLPFS